PRQDLGKHLAVDVAAAQHETDALSAHAHALLEERGQRRGPGALGDIVGIFPDGAHGLRDLVFAHAHDACRSLPEDGKCRLVRQAMPSAKVAAELVGTGRPSANDRATAGAFSATTPTISVSRPRRSRTVIRPQIPDPMPMGT